MIDRLYIAQLEKQYIPYLKNIVLDAPFQPIMLRGGKTKPATTAELHQLVKLFQANEKNQRRQGWCIEWEEWTSKKLGKQQWPSVIRVATEEDFLYLLKKEKEAGVFKEQLALLLQWNPLIRPWLSSRPKMILELREAWGGICGVIDYLLQYEVKGHYLRSIAVPVHTKFIEQHKKTVHSILHHLESTRFPSTDIDLEDALFLNRKPFLFTLRWLDENLATKYTMGMDLFAVPADYLRQQQWDVERILLVENETNLYLFSSMPSTLVICSYGKALHLLREIGFLHTTQLYYWGDMDDQGFAMLNDIRNYYSHIISLFMDDATLTHHQKELDTKPVPYKKKDLLLLHPHESRAYEFLLNSSQWLEQEKLQQSYVHDRLHDI